MKDFPLAAISRFLVVLVLAGTTWLPPSPAFAASDPPRKLSLDDSELRAAAETHEEAAETSEDAEEALLHFSKAIELRQRLESFDLLAENYYSRGLHLLGLDRDDEARGDFEQALAAALRSGSRIHQADALNGLGRVAQNEGDLATARQFYEQAVTGASGTGEPEKEFLYLRNLAFVVNWQGDGREATLIYRKAGKIADEYDSRGHRGANLIDLGWVEHCEKRPEIALDLYLSAMDYLEDMELGDRLLLADRLATTLAKLERPEEAWDSYWNAIELARSKADWASEARTWISICGLSVRFPQLDRPGAADACEQSAAAIAKLKNPHLLASHYRSQAQFYRQAGRLEEALASSERAVQLVELLRFKIAGRKKRAGYSQERSLFFRQHADLLMAAHQHAPRAGHDLEAIALAERFRARSLLDLWSEAGVDLLASADPQLLAELESSQDELMLLQTRKAADRDDLISASLAELDRLNQRLRESSPAYRKVVPASPIAAGEIRDLLDADTAVALLLLGDAQSHLFILRHRGEVQSFELGPPATLTKAAQEHFALLRDPRSAPSKVLKTGQKLAALLWGEQEERLAGLPPRLVFLGDGDLQQFPIDALPRLGSTVKNPRYLAESFEVVHLPSLTLLRQQRRERREAPTRGALVLADPYYSRPSPDGLKIEKVDISELRRRFPKSPKPPSLGRLAHADLEARLIGSRFRTARRQLDLATGAAASKQRALAPDTGRYGILHFTSHGQLDPQHAELSALRLAEVNAEGQPVDGKLQLQDLYDLRLRADLVVASACQTAVGENLRLEGVGGLAQGFLQAGARRALVSLWQVESKSTAYLMDRFYEQLLAGEKPSRALQLAKISLMKKDSGHPRAWRSPFYWSGFVLIGDWSAFELPEKGGAAEQSAPRGVER